MTNRSSCYIRHPSARNCRRRRGNSPDLMLCDGLWKVLCISTWRLFYAFLKEVVEREPANAALVPINGMSRSS